MATAIRLVSCELAIDFLVNHLLVMDQAAKLFSIFLVLRQGRMGSSSEIYRIDASWIVMLFFKERRTVVSSVCDLVTSFIYNNLAAS